MELEEQLDVLLQAFVDDVRGARDRTEKLAAVRIFIDKLTALYYLHALDTFSLPEVEYTAAKRVVEAHEKRREEQQ